MAETVFRAREVPLSVVLRRNLPMGHYWTHDKLINALASKFCRLIVVKGRKKDDHVRCDLAHLYWEPKTTMFIEAIQRGIIAIDFDARTNNGRGLRNHGTKFRVKYDDLRYLYGHRKKFE